MSLTYFSLPLVGHWLVREDPIHKADAIAVLTGRFPQRVVEAALLYHRGYAHEIWLTRPKDRDPLDEPEDTRNLRVLRSFGVPKRAIHVLNVPIVNTADELNAIDSGLKKTGDTSVIIVTNKAHTRRVFSLWDKYHSGDGKALIHAVSFDRFAPSNWWKTPSSRTQGIHELLGMVNLWAGMPVHRPLQSGAFFPSAFWRMDRSVRGLLEQSSSPRQDPPALPSSTPAATKLSLRVLASLLAIVFSALRSMLSFND